MNRTFFTEQIYLRILRLFLLCSMVTVISYFASRTDGMFIQVSHKNEIDLLLFTPYGCSSNGIRPLKVTFGEEPDARQPLLLWPDTVQRGARRRVNGNIDLTKKVWMNARIIEIDKNHNILVEGKSIYAEYKELRVLPKSEDEQFIEESLEEGDLIRIQYDGHVFETLPPDIIALSIEKRR